MLRVAGALRAGLLLALLAPLVGCGVAHTKADCDLLLSQEKWNTVLQDCDNPYHRASAYLGLAGLDLFTILESNTAVTNVV
ncbi:MAG TPA: hypothetical protein VL359_12650, partial [bacterium]|nr:hypothetical protein [bacterium]